MPSPALLAVSDAELGPDSPFVYNLASGRGTSLNGIVSALASCLGRKIAVEHLPARGFDVPISVSMWLGRGGTELGAQTQLCRRTAVALNDTPAQAAHASFPPFNRSA